MAMLTTHTLSTTHQSGTKCPHHPHPTILHVIPPYGCHLWLQRFWNVLRTKWWTNRFRCHSQGLIAQYSSHRLTKRNFFRICLLKQPSFTPTQHPEHLRSCDDKNLIYSPSSIFTQKIIISLPTYLFCSISRLHPHYFVWSLAWDMFRICNK